MVGLLFCLLLYVGVACRLFWFLHRVSFGDLSSLRRFVCYGFVSVFFRAGF